MRHIGLAALVVLCAAVLSHTGQALEPAPGTDEHLPSAPVCPLATDPSSLLPGLSRTACTHAPSEDPVAAVAGVVPGSISGLVTEEGTGLPLAEVCVAAFDQDGDIGAVVKTADDGSYEVAVEPGTYNVWFNDCGSPGYHVSEWYDNAATSADAQDLGVAEGEARTGIDASLSMGGGEINGTITSDANGEPLAGVCAVALDQSLTFAGMSFSDALGAFSMQGVSGDLRLIFLDCFEPLVHIPEWWEDTRDFASSDIISIDGGEKQTIGAGLTAGGSINGTVTDAAGVTPLSGVCVDLFDAAGLFRGGARTGSSGTYSVGGLPPGNHRVRFTDCESPLYYVEEWYLGRTSFQTADQVSVGGPGSKHGQVNGTLQLGGSIEGAVDDASTHADLVGICVTVFNTANEFVAATTTGSQGLFEVGGLSPAQYKLLSSDCRPAPEYIREWWNDRTSIDQATRVTVSAGAAAELTVVNLSKGGLVNGTARDASTNAVVPGICVYADSTTGITRGFDVTDDAGRYTIPLPQAGHKIVFVDCRDEPVYNPQWYDRHETFESANVVAIGPVGSKASGRDAHLFLHIAGDVDCTTTVTSVDAVLVLQLVAGLIGELECQFNSDPSGDNVITSVDAVLILQYVAGLLSSLP